MKARGRERGRGIYERGKRKRREKNSGRAESFIEEGRSYVKYLYSYRIYDSARYAYTVQWEFLRIFTNFPEFSPTPTNFNEFQRILTN